MVAVLFVPVTAPVLSPPLIMVQITTALGNNSAGSSSSDEGFLSIKITAAQISHGTMFLSDFPAQEKSLSVPGL